MSAIAVRYTIQPLAAALDHVAAFQAGSARAAWLSAEALEPLARWPSGNRLEPVAFFEQLLALAPRFDREADLAASALRKLLPADGAAMLAPGLGQHLGALRRAAQAARPALREELAAAAAAALWPAWEGHHVRLLDQVVRWTDDDWLVEGAEILLLPAVRGGFGAAHPAANLARIEILTDDPAPAPPEVLRLIWLLAQLNADLPAYQGQLTRPQTARTTALAMVPIVLEAGQAADLIVHDSATRETALAAWGLSPLDDVPAYSATIDRWWQVYRESRPAWRTGLAALAKMLEAPADAPSA